MKYFLLRYLKTLKVGPAGVWTHDLSHGIRRSTELSQPVGGHTDWSEVVVNGRMPRAELCEKPITRATTFGDPEIGFNLARKNESGL